MQPCASVNPGTVKPGHNALGKTLLGFLVFASTQALAGPADKIYTPQVVKGETEFELRGGYEDADRGANP